MAVFKDRIELTQRLDGHILLNGSISLYFKNHILEESLSWFKENKYISFSFDCSQWTSEEEFHKDVSRVFGFPDYYGENLNAFNDCMSDFEIPYGEGVIVILKKFDHYTKKFPDSAQSLLDVLEISSRRFLLTGRKLITLVQSDDPTISFDPVGACPVMWNGKEWLKKNRGLL